MSNSENKAQKNKQPNQRWGTGTRIDASDQARQFLIQSATKCYIKKGIKNTTMSDIAEESKVGRATVYKYFDNKENVLKAVFCEAVISFNEHFKTKLKDYDNFCDLFLGYLTYTLEVPRSSFLWEVYFSEDSAPWMQRIYFMEEGALKSTMQLFQERFEQAEKVGEIRANINYRELILWSHRLIVSIILSPDFDTTPIEVFRGQIEQFFIQSIKAT